MTHRIADGLRTVVEPELIEDVPDVKLHGVLAEVQAPSELPVRRDSLDHQLEYLALTIRKSVRLGSRDLCGSGRLRKLLQQLARERRRQRRLTIAGAIEKCEELVRLEVLEQIPLRSGLDGVEECLVMLRRRQHHDFDVGLLFCEYFRGGDAVQLRHR